MFTLNRIYILTDTGGLFFLANQACHTAKYWISGRYNLVCLKVCDKQENVKSSHVLAVGKLFDDALTLVFIVKLSLQLKSDSKILQTN